jgi:hypothetical protein
VGTSTGRKHSSYSDLLTVLLEQESCRQRAHAIAQKYTQSLEEIRSEHTSSRIEALWMKQ